MSKNFYCVFVTLFVCASSIFAQSEQTSNNQTSSSKNASASTATESTSNVQTANDELPRYEVGAHFTTLHRNFSLNPGGNGVGGRFTVNLNRNVALEAEGNFLSGGRSAQGLFGVKAGKRFNKFGVFGKARPGFVYSYKAWFDYELAEDNNFVFRRRSQTNFALDLGGVLEFYPTKRIITRFDFGDTIIRVGERNISFPVFEGETVVSRQFQVPSQTRHNFQFSAGVGFRF